MLNLQDSPLAALQQFIAGNEYLSHKFVVFSIAKAIKNNEPCTKLFIAQGGLYTAIIYPRDYTLVMSKAIKAFIKEEDYEMCQFAQRWLDRWQIQELTKSKNTE